MSVGGLLGAVVGGITGFFIGGPVGAVYGASIGFGVGSFVDPLTPDMPSAGAPVEPEQVVMKSTVGDPCPDLCGTAKITGHLLNYGGEGSVPIYSDPVGGGGKGSEPEPQPQVTGHDYTMSWQVGICKGPVTTLHAIYKNENEVIWEGPLDRPGSGGQETITVQGFGTIEFYFGTTDQVANTNLGALLDDDTLNSPLRGYCWAFMDDCTVGNYPRTPSLSFVVTKQLEMDYVVTTTIQTYDCSPLAVQYYILNTLCGLPETWLDEDDWVDADATIRDEYRGISCLFNEQQSALSWLQNINSHIDCILRYGNDGKFHPKLIRDDYTVASLPVIDEDDLIEDPSIIRPSWIDTVNEVKIQYTEINGIDEDDRDKSKLYYNIWGSGINGILDARMSDLFALGDHYLFVESSSVHPYYATLWKSISAGYTGFGIDLEDALYVWGQNGYGQAGIDSTDQKVDIQEVPLFSGTKMLYAHGESGASCVIDEDGTLYTAGRNQYNNLGLYGVTSDTEVPEFTQVQTGVDIPLTWIGGAFSTLYGQAIGADGCMYTVGGAVPTILGNGWGSVGATRDVLYFEKVPYPVNENWSGKVRVTLSSQTWAEKTDGTVYACGSNNYGSFGLGDTTARDELTILPGVWKTWSTNSGGYIFIGVTTAGELKGAGSNNVGALGLGSGSLGLITSMTTLKSGTWISAHTTSSDSCIALRDDGTVWAAGKVSTGTLGVGLERGIYYDWTQVDMSGELFDIMWGGENFTLLAKEV